MTKSEASDLQIKIIKILNTWFNCNKWFNNKLYYVKITGANGAHLVALVKGVKILAEFACLAEFEKWFNGFTQGLKTMQGLFNDASMKQKKLLNAIIE